MGKIDAHLVGGKKSGLAMIFSRDQWGREYLDKSSVRFFSSRLTIAEV